MKPEDEAFKEMGEAARAASRIIAVATAAEKDRALREAAREIRTRGTDILAVNAREVDAARSRGLSDSFLDRMQLDEDRLESVAASLEAIAEQDDPIGEVMSEWTRPNGLSISRVRAPIGVVGVIYESRPNVTVDASAICIKAGSAAILRSGSDCLDTAKALHTAFCAGLKKAGLPGHAVQLVQTTDRTAVGAILSGLDGAIDLIVPRGGKSLVARVQEEARAPVLSHLDGICHVYVDRAASLEKAIAITVNAKMRRPGICGAAETLLVDRRCAESVLPAIADALMARGCALRGDAAACAIVPAMTQATREDFETEYLAPILSVAVVDGVDGALAHLAAFSSGHTDAIITEDPAAAEAFLTHCDSAIVLHNASTQFADGGEFGLGAEIGIATGKLHARGPVGVRELTTYKNIVRGSGQVRP